MIYRISGLRGRWFMAKSRKANLGFLLMIVLVLSGCGKKTAQLQSKAVPPDKTLYENAVTYLKKSQYIKARLSLQTLINTYPDSDYTPKAFFEVGNTYYKEGGTESLMQAETQFRDFQLFYPTSELTAEAQFKIAALNMRLMLEPERDATHSRKAEEELKKFIEKFPEHEFTPVAKLFLKDVQENEAQTVYKIGQFYYDRKLWKAAIGRYKQVADNFPEFSRADEIIYKLGDSYEKNKQSEEAAQFYSRVSSEYPNSEYAKMAQERLIALQKPIPEVNSERAEQHQKANPDEGFSLFRPLKDFMAAMGLTGQGDPYEKAVDILKQEREIREMMAAKQKLPTDSQTQASDAEDKDIVISTTISKTADSPAKSNTSIRDPGKAKSEQKPKSKKDENKNKKNNGK